MPKEAANDALGRGGSFEALPDDLYQDCPIKRVLAYRVTKTDQKDKSKTYLATALDIWFFSGLTRENDEGSEYDLNINYGFVTLSFYETSKFRKLLNTLGITVSSDNPTLDYDFMGEYAGHSFLDLPLYPGHGAKADYAIEMTHFKIEGQELLGRHATLDVSTNDKGYNVIENFVRSKKKPLDLSEVSSLEYLAWKNQDDALSWAQTMTAPDGTPVFKDDEKLASEYKDLFEQYEGALGEGEEPNREDFYRHWYEAVHAWARSDVYNIQEGALPF